MADKELSPKWKILEKGICGLNEEAVRLRDENTKLKKENKELKKALQDKVL